MSEKVNAPEISVKNVSMVFSDSKGNPVQALKNVSIDIQKGEFISLLGPSGCGKSTLLTVCGKTPRETRLEQKFGIVFQNPVLLDWRTVRKNIRLPLEMMKVPKEEQASRIEQVLELVGLKEFGNSYPGQLSGGMQQRVGIARALAIQPDILLMDEPFSALDEFTREKLNDDVLSIWRKTNKTVLLVTHNISESVYMSDRICVLSPHPGRLSAIVDVNLPRPRVPDMRGTPEFAALVEKVRNSFEGI